jgi:hypothetical protein
MVKMHAKNQRNDVVNKNQNSLCDVEVIPGLRCILSLLKCVHALIKVAQIKDVFVCNFVEVVKVTQQEFYRLYCDPYAKFEDPTFDNFNVIESLTNFNLLEWSSNFNGGKDYLVFSFVGHKYLVYLSSDDGVGGLQPITKLALSWVINNVKEECEGVAWGLVSELEKQFLNHEVMIVLGVFYL